MGLACLSIGTPYLLTIIVLKFEIVHSIPYLPKVLEHLIYLPYNVLVLKFEIVYSVRYLPKVLEHLIYLPYLS